MNLLTFIFCTFSTLPDTSAVTEKIRDLDKINFIPDSIVDIKTFQYSGFVNGRNSSHHLHYWLVLSDVDTDSYPLIIWVNDGCSSLLSLFIENGPYRLLNDGRLIENRVSWSKIANLLYLDSEVGMGFSYGFNPQNSIDDEAISEDSYHAILNFMEKFPEFRNRDVYLAGKGYAGVSLPILATKLIENAAVRLKGLFIGNPLTNEYINMETAIHVGYFYGLYDDSVYRSLLKICCLEECDEDCVIVMSSTSRCSEKLRKHFVPSEVLNLYNILSDCSVEAGDEQSTQPLYLSTQVPSSFTRMLESHHRCLNSTSITEYLNRPNVTEAIHVHPELSGPWKICKPQGDSLYRKSSHDVADVYLRVLQAGVPITLYSGDVDMVYNHMGSRKFVHNLGLKPLGKLKPWMLKDEQGTTQIGGWEKAYTMNGTTIKHVTVRGAGHMASNDRPSEVFFLVSQFVHSMSPSHRRSIWNWRLFLLFIYLMFTKHSF